MTYTVKFTTAYKKSYKLMKKRGLDLTLLDDVVDDLRQGIVGHVHDELIIECSPIPEIQAESVQAWK